MQEESIDGFLDDEVLLEEEVQHHAVGPGSVGTGREREPGESGNQGRVGTGKECEPGESGTREIAGTGE